MRERDYKTAEKFGVLDRCLAFERELLQIKDVIPDQFDEGIPFDLDGFYSDIRYVIIVPKYDIAANREDYWEARKTMLANIILLAKQYDLHRTEDSIEDYGAHWYIVFSCGNSWTINQPVKN